MALRAVPDHPKFADLKARLKVPKYRAAGLLEMVWHFAGRYTPQGNIGKYPDHAIEAWVEWDGKPGALMQALVDAHWLDRDPVHRLLVHDWAQHADKATKNALNRAKLPFCTPTVRTASVLGTNEKPDSGTVSRLPEPEPVPEPASKDSCTAASAAPALDREGQRITMPLNTGADWPVIAADCLAWVKTYPGVDVQVELLRAREWLISHPRNRKTQRGMRSFLTAWLGRAQDRAHPTGEFERPLDGRENGAPQPNGARASATTTRVAGNIAAIDAALARRGIRRTGAAGAANGNAISGTRPEGLTAIMSQP